MTSPKAVPPLTIWPNAESRPVFAVAGERLDIGPGVWKFQDELRELVQKSHEEALPLGRVMDQLGPLHPDLPADAWVPKTPTELRTLLFASTFLAAAFTEWQTIGRPASELVEILRALIAAEEGTVASTEPLPPPLGLPVFLVKSSILR